MSVDIDFLYPIITVLELGHLYCQGANNVTLLSLQSIICSHSVFCFFILSVVGNGTQRIVKSLKNNEKAAFHFGKNSPVDTLIIK